MRNTIIPDPEVLVVCLIAMVCLVTGLGKLWNSWASSDWPSTVGVVLDSELVFQSDAETTSTDAYILYEYTVDGRSYTDARISYSERTLNQSRWARELVEKHPAGSAIRVYYDPNEPYRATLFPGVKAAGYAQAGLGLILLAIAGGGHVLSRGRLRP